MIKIELTTLNKYVKTIKCSCGHEFKAVGKRFICPKCKRLLSYEKDKS
ncbi:hypothetical protein [Methanocaldococcus infernus]|uniref:Uncharacterized protein n=1 Tax=Methanocaldococcus infernus (strain DSM 11812 / JCM 15783 / ME) TaxID=573063 RepID=D5VRH6_METIM|nr:hypothetical protein [Methanocaldococcus infernus]ADG13179.1 conserved hypothetical protein [Methanocaldococcus infernus ME]